MSTLREQALANVAARQEADPVTQAIKAARERAAATLAQQKREADDAAAQRATERREAAEAALQEEARRAFLRNPAATDADFTTWWHGGGRFQTLGDAARRQDAEAHASHAQLYRVF